MQSGGCHESGGCSSPGATPTECNSHCITKKCSCIEAIQFYKSVTKRRIFTLLEVLLQKSMNLFSTFYNFAVECFLKNIFEK